VTCRGRGGVTAYRNCIITVAVSHLPSCGGRLLGGAPAAVWLLLALSGALSRKFPGLKLFESDNYRWSGALWATHRMVKYIWERYGTEMAGNLAVLINVPL
jgi:hypothetical protein